MIEALLSTELPLANRRVGKVRDVYDVTLPDGGEGVLMVATDRVSVFDVVLANGIPGKGKLLTTLSRFWFEFFTGQFSHHLVSTDPGDIDGLSEGQREMLNGRIMICRKTRVVPVECIVRGYLTGSGYREYLREGSVCGIELPGGMVNSDRIGSPIFTPSTKARQGHDQNISFRRACELVGADTMESIRQTSMDAYRQGRDYALERGIIIADTKFEFGRTEDGRLLLIDEVLTPDSSRFWPADQWRAGEEQDSFDKQYVRNYTEELVSQGLWDKTAPGPELPLRIIENTLKRYDEAVSRLIS